MSETTPETSREIRLASRPVGEPTPSNFSTADVPVGEPGPYPDELVAHAVPPSRSVPGARGR